MEGEAMSIILKGIDMPDRIDLDFHDNHIVLGGILYPIDIDQLVYIPAPHGRLIDADALYKFFEDALNKNPLDDWWEAGAVLDNIELAPTILESEGNDENRND